MMRGRAVGLVLMGKRGELAPAFFAVDRLANAETGLN